MNYTELLRQCVAYFSFAIASIFVLSLVGFLLRRQLRMLFDRWRALGRLGQCVTLVFVSGFVLYGGSKHLPPTQTNDSQNADEPLLTVLPPWDSPLVDAAACRVTSCDETTRGAPMTRQAVASTAGDETTRGAPMTRQAVASTSCDEITRGAPMTRQAVASTAGETSDEATFRQTSQPELSRWAARGAWIDWQRIEFPDGFAFPIGTNQITEVTLMSYGALIPASSFQLLASRSEQPIQSSTTDIQTLLHSNILTLPCRVSLEPGESSIHYGLTPSNSFLIAWENVCVERSATNRVDASIELFRNGDTLVTIQPLSQPSQPSLFFTPAALPEGWVGEGQDAAWASTAFPSNATDIAAMGYENWLADYVGVNEANGRYQVKISVMTLPDGPCYLVCGPYKTVITAPGVYCFPLEVFETYHVRTYPVAVPLSFEYDDGYRGDETNAHAACLSAALPSPTGRQADNDYYLCEMPRIVITPNYIPYDQAEGATVSIWANVKSSVRGFFTSLSGLSRVVLTGGGSRAEIIQAQVGDSVRYNLEKLGHHCDAEITIGSQSNDHEEPCCCDACCGDYCSCDGTCCACRCNCWGYMPETSGTNGTTTVTQP